MNPAEYEADTPRAYSAIQQKSSNMHKKGHKHHHKHRAQEWDNTSLRHMGKQDDFKATAPDGYKEHIEWTPKGNMDEK